ncbi:hypothetical protein F2Q68_00002812 [Brassica cretica]|uniref:Uncharacterized protein n=1 Tax=Brassica cretica TaxID=69181 RepID=A0A8S9JH72_BRACR|nr:hypothetical protein F2Q68_00002812 [Brassica cretica]
MSPSLKSLMVKRHVPLDALTRLILSNQSDHSPDTVLFHREQLLREELRMRPRHSPPLRFFAVTFDDLEQIATVSCVVPSSGFSRRGR